MKSVPFSVVRDLLADAGYVIQRRRKFSDESEAFIYVFAHETLVDLAVPVSEGRVDDEHFQLIQSLLSEDDYSKGTGHEEDEDSSEGP